MLQSRAQTPFESGQLRALCRYQDSLVLLALFTRTHRKRHERWARDLVRKYAIAHKVHVYMCFRLYEQHGHKNKQLSKSTIFQDLIQRHKRSDKAGAELEKDVLAGKLTFQYTVH